MSEFDRVTDEWERDCLQELAHDHENEVYLKFALLAAQLGYPHACIAVELPTSAIDPVVTLWANYADDWVEKFVVRHVRHHGARVGYGKRKSEPLPGRHQYHWSRCDFMREAQAYGIEFDIQERIHGQRGTVAQIGLSGLGERDLVQHHTKLRILIDLTMDVMTRLLLDKYLPQHTVTVNDAERRYMNHVLDGFSNDDIAQILGITRTEALAMQRGLPKRFDRVGIVPTCFLAYKMGLLEEPGDGAADQVDAPST